MGLLKPAACSSDLICATQKIFQLIKENSCIKKTLLTHHYVVLFVETLAVVEDQLVRYNILKLLNEVKKKRQMVGRLNDHLKLPFVFFSSLPKIAIYLKHYVF